MDAVIHRTRQSSGFTIVELLIVIVVIGILAAITIVAYNGIQGRAQDTTRLSDISRIQKALELYKIDKGVYPNANPDPNSWERSTTNPDGFLSSLKPYMGGDIPVDPENSGGSYYYYYRYPAGHSSYAPCPANRGGFYVLGINSLKSQSGLAVSPGWNCESGSTVPTNGAWVRSTSRAVWGSFEN